MAILGSKFHFLAFLRNFTVPSTVPSCTVMTVPKFWNDDLTPSCTASTVRPYFDRPYRHTVIAQPWPYIYSAYTVFFAGNSSNIQSYTVHIYTVLAITTYYLMCVLSWTRLAWQQRTLTHWFGIYHWAAKMYRSVRSCIGLARIVYIHRIWLYIW